MEKNPVNVTNVNVLHIWLHSYVRNLDGDIPTPGVHIPTPGVQIPTPGVQIPTPGVHIPTPVVYIAFKHDHVALSLHCILRILAYILTTIKYC